MQDNEFKEILRHWLSLSAAQRKGLSALAHEIETASQLVEASVEQLSERFMELANTAQDQAERIAAFSQTQNEQSVSSMLRELKEGLSESTTLAEGQGESSNILPTVSVLERLIEQSVDVEKTLASTCKQTRFLSSSIADIVVRMQFQDRTSQRLSHISNALQVIVGLLAEMENETISGQETSLPVEPNQAWMEAMIKDMHLSEMRERFIKHTLLGGEDNSSGGDLEVEYGQSSDDVELF